MYVVYGNNNCPYCDTAKQLLESKGLEYTQKNIDEDDEARHFILNQGLRTIPQVFYEEDLGNGQVYLDRIGTYEELATELNS